MNRRSWTHDSGVACAVLDSVKDERTPIDPGGLGDGARALPRRLRSTLWREHLGPEVSQAELLDPRAGFEAWAQDGLGARRLARRWGEGTGTRALSPAGGGLALGHVVGAPPLPARGGSGRPAGQPQAIRRFLKPEGSSTHGRPEGACRLRNERLHVVGGRSRVLAPNPNLTVRAVRTPTHGHRARTAAYFPASRHGVCVPVPSPGSNRAVAWPGSRDLAATRELIKAL